MRLWYRQIGLRECAVKLPRLSRVQGLGVNLASARGLSPITEQLCNITLFVNGACKGEGRRE